MTYAFDTVPAHSDYSAQFATGIVASLPRPVGGLNPRTLARLQAHIDSNIESSLTMTELAELTGLSTSHFARCFRKSVGLPPHSYVKRRRVERARELLTRTNLPVAEIALVTGFSDQSHFTRRFREIIGVPPGAYRFQHR
jgi:transcriptional regulator GlxA family with amidase domain